MYLITTLVSKVCGFEEHFQACHESKENQGGNVTLTILGESENASLHFSK
jgi:hypothetical protein